MSDLPVLVLLGVLALIVVRRAGALRVAIWQAMLAGAAIVLLTGATTPARAWDAIDRDVMLFLFGMFVVGEALVESGYLFFVSYRLLRRIRSSGGLVLAVLAGSGFTSALLMNDTLAIIGTPLMLLLARQHGLPPQLLLLALAFGVTTGSVASPIGNPQNLLIALSGGLSSPFLEFLGGLLLPTLISLVLAWCVLRVVYRRHFHPAPLCHAAVGISDPALARLARLALGLVLAGVAARIAAALWWPGLTFRLTWIALAGALPLLLFSPRRGVLLRRLDWHTLVFFAALFVLMESVWRAPLFQSLVAAAGGGLDTLPVVMGVGVGLSQLVSNVPLVALYLPVLADSGPQLLLALAAASTLAGNLLVPGAASNVIIIQAAERRDGTSLGFLEFARAGIPLTLLQLGIFGWFLGRGVA
ncbi:SLC13 family permease [Thioalbus denitrificans]|uniref:YbiR family transporter n=1 Tax=Thioalbus denitrificans TaxID=547122 RepID=A0A369CHD9_9GAMM|nr:SLC13 family permease [Thioalbus denitrificans]RCX31254.1 YbiR family transporter [Thioalbus denitrificans]